MSELAHSPERRITTLDIVKADLSLRFDGVKQAARSFAQSLKNPVKLVSNYSLRVMEGVVATTSIVAPAVAAEAVYQVVQVANPSVVSADGCPPLPTDGKPAPYCLVPEGTDLNAAMRMSRFYYIDKDGNIEYSQADEDVMGVPGAQILVESLEGIGFSDFTDIDLKSRKIESINGIQRVSYLDRKTGDRRYVEKTFIMRVPADGGNGLALLSNGSDVLKFHGNVGSSLDKVWGPTNTDARNERHACGGSTPCTWQCVQWIVASRLRSNVMVSDGQAVPNEFIYVDANGRVGAIVDSLYYYDQAQNEFVKIDHNYLNTGVKPGDSIWTADKVHEAPVVRPPKIKAYNNH